MSPRRRTIGTTTSLALAVAGVAACQPLPPPAIPAIAGLTTTYVAPSPGERGSGSITTITLTTAHTLSVTCDHGTTLVINAVPTRVACDTMDSLQITGTAAADTVHVDLQARPAINIDLLGGNDRSYVGAPSSSVTNGGDGNDTLTALTLVPFGTAGRLVTEVSALSGGPGNDTLTDMGWNGPVDGTDPDFIDFANMTLDGGPGADTLHGSTVRPEKVVTDPYDTLDLQGGPGDITMGGTDGPDTVVVDLNGNWGPQGSVTTPDGVTHPFALPRLTRNFTIATGAGDDDITVSHRSYGTATDVAGGDGADRLHVQPSMAGYQFDKYGVYQPGAKSISYWFDVEWTEAHLVPRT